MPSIQFNILNQLQTPAFYASSLATRPSFGYPGRIFIDTDIPSTGLYRDTGSAWVSIADPGAGTTGTLQQVTTNGKTTDQGIAISANGLGIGTTTPNTNRIDVHSASGLQGTFNGTGTTNAALQLQNAGVGKWNLRNNYNAGANDFGIYDVTNSIDRISISNAGVIQFTGNIGIGGNAVGQLSLVGAANDTWASSGTSALTLNGSNGTISTISTYLDNTSIRIGAGVTEKTGLFINGTTATGGSYVSISAGGSERFRINATSLNLTNRLNVAGAIDNSSYQLNVNGNAKANELLLNTNLTVVSGGKVFINSLGYFVDGGFDSFIGSSGVGAGNDMILYTNVTERLRIKTSGASVFSSTLGINGIEDSVKGDTYTPTVTNNSGTSVLSASQVVYLRVGNRVHVGMMVSLTPTGLGTLSFTVTLPFSMSVVNQVLSGNATTLEGTTGRIVYNSATTAIVYYSQLALIPNQIYLQFSYSIV